MTGQIIKVEPTSLARQEAIGVVKALVLDTVSERSRRDYGRALDGFTDWLLDEWQHGLNKAAVMAYVAHLKAQGVPPSSVNQRLSAIRKLAKEAADNGLIVEADAQAIGRVENLKRQGKKLGNWLDAGQAEKMLNAPDVATMKGLRDRAILAIALGCGLRREEIAKLRKSDFAQRAGRWVILDLEGKHGRVRTVPTAAWVKHIVDTWAYNAGLSGDDYLFPPMRKGGRLQDGHMSPQAIWQVVQAYAPVEKLAPHDLRRTFAKLAHKNGCPIEQIQQSLGHASIKTTEAYVGVDLDLQNAPSDYVKLDVL